MELGKKEEQKVQPPLTQRKQNMVIAYQVLRWTGYKWEEPLTLSHPLTIYFGFFLKLFHQKAHIGDCNNGSHQF